MLHTSFLFSKRQQKALSMLVKISDHFHYDEQDKAIQHEAKECLHEVYKLMCSCHPTRDSCFPCSYMEAEQFDFLRVYARIELFMTHGNYCHALNELHKLDHIYGLLPSRIYYPVLHLLERV